MTRAWELSNDVRAWRFSLVFLTMTKVDHFLLAASSAVDLVWVKTVFGVLVRQPLLVIRYDRLSFWRQLLRNTRYRWRNFVSEKVFTITHSWELIRWWSGTIHLIHIQLPERRWSSVVILFHLNLHQTMLTLLVLILKLRAIDDTLLWILHNLICFIRNLIMIIEATRAQSINVKAIIIHQLWYILIT